VRFAVENLLLVLAVASTAFPQISKSENSEKSDDAQEIRRSMIEIERAFVSRDPEPFDRLFIEGYVNIREKPVFNYRDQLAAMVRWDAAAIKSGKKLDFETLSYESDVPTISLYGDSAIVTTQKKNLWRYKDDKCLTHYQSTELWLRMEGRWKVAAGHVSTIQCEPLPWNPPHPAVAPIRTLSKPIQYISTSTETELRELLSKLNDAGLRTDSNTDAFTAKYISTEVKGVVTNDRSTLLSTLKVPTMRNRERYRDDEIFLSFGSAAMYLFRVRSFPKAGETAPPVPVVFSVMFVKSGNNWQIAASHASEIAD
jgi:hypothetical protein